MSVLLFFCYHVYMKKSIKALLYVQMILVLAGLLTQLGLFIFAIANNLNALMIVSYGVLLLAHVGAIVYGIIGYKRGPIRYILLVSSFLLAILLNIILPFRDIPQRISLVLLFGLMSVFMLKQDDYKFTNYLILVAVVVALFFSIYSSINANPNALGDVKYKELATVFMYLSIFAPVMFVGFFGVSYNAKKSLKSY